MPSLHKGQSGKSSLDSGENALPRLLRLITRLQETLETERNLHFPTSLSTRPAASQFCRMENGVRCTGLRNALR